MADADSTVIAWLYPDPGSGVRWNNIREIIESRPNRARYVPPQLSRSTAALADTGNSSELCGPCLQLTFNPWPRYQQGLIFGWDPACDIVLPNVSGISFRHGALSFDEQNRPIYVDLGSRNGSRVTYSGEGNEARKDFRWVLGGHTVPEKRTIILRFNQTISFQLVICEHDLASPQYIRSVDLFRQGTEDVGDLLDRFDLARPETEPASGADSPGSGPITLKIKVGEGAFAAVYRIWDVSTAVDTAIKKPSRRAIRNGLVREDGWRNEDRIMRRLSHPNIVAFLGSDFSIAGRPQLMLEYVPRGPLSRHKRNLTNRECVQILVQCLSAVTYLHEQKPHPVVHRDIKPDNILVQERYGGYIHVKLADFGLTKDSSELTTICGSPLYQAPEIYEELARRNAAVRRDVNRRAAAQSYSPAVDLWSTGVVLGDCVYGLPEHGGSQPIGLRWCRKVSTALRGDAKKNPTNVSHLIAAMVDMSPDRRGSARDLHGRALLADPVESEEETEGSQAPSQAAAPSVSSWPSSSSSRRPSYHGNRHGHSHRQQRQRQESLADERVPGLYDALNPLGGGSTLAGGFVEENADWDDPQSAQASASDPHPPGADCQYQPPGPAPGSLAPPSGDVWYNVDPNPAGVEDDAGQPGWDDATAANLLLTLRDAV